MLVVGVVWWWILIRRTMERSGWATKTQSSDRAVAEQWRAGSYECGCVCACNCHCVNAMANYTGHEACDARRGSAARTGTRCESHARAWVAPSCSRGMGSGVRFADCRAGASGCWEIADDVRRARSSKVAATIWWRMDPRLCMWCLRGDEVAKGRCGFASCANCVSCVNYVPSDAPPDPPGLTWKLW